MNNNGRFQKLRHKSKIELSGKILFLAQLKNGHQTQEVSKFYLKKYLIGTTEKINKNPDIYYSKH